MKKSKKIDLLNKVKNDDQEVSKYLNTYLITNALMKLFFVILLLVFSICMNTEISKLSYISPKAFIIVSIVFITILALFIILLIYNKFIKDDSIKPKVIYKIFDFYDMISFIGLTIQVVFFIILFIITPTTVSGDSMDNTLANDDKMLVWHMAYTPKRDDIIIIDVTEEKYHYSSTDKFFIKRIVAVPGDELKYDILSQEFYVNDNLVQTRLSYSQFSTMTTLRTNISISCTNSLIVPDGYYIVLGDNRNVSVDSRSIGLIREEDILGKAVFRLYSKEHKNLGYPKKYILNS